MAAAPANRQQSEAAVARYGQDGMAVGRAHSTGAPWSQDANNSSMGRTVQGQKSASPTYHAGLRHAGSRACSRACPGMPRQGGMSCSRARRACFVQNMHVARIRQQYFLSSKTVFEADNSTNDYISPATQVRQGPVSDCNWDTIDTLPVSWPVVLSLRKPGIGAEHAGRARIGYWGPLCRLPGDRGTDKQL